MTKHKRTKRRNQKGGLWPFSSTDSSVSSTGESSISSQSWGDRFSGYWNKTKEKVSSGTNSLESGLGDISEKTSSSVSSMGTSMSEGLGNLNPFSSSDSSISNSSTIIGGKRKNKYSSKRRRKTIKGGKGGLGLTYYATPVSGIRVAEPTTWQFYENGVNQYSIKGGSKKRRTHRRHKKKTRRYKRY
jgi:hypothetical protein